MSGGIFSHNIWLKSKYFNLSLDVEGLERLLVNCGINHKSQFFLCLPLSLIHRGVHSEMKKVWERDLRSKIAKAQKSHGFIRTTRRLEMRQRHAISQQFLVVYIPICFQQSLRTLLVVSEKRVYSCGREMCPLLIGWCALRCRLGRKMAATARLLKMEFLVCLRVVIFERGSCSAVTCIT